VAGLFYSLVGAVPRVPAPISETHTKSWTKRVGTGALPLQNDDLSENETALIDRAVSFINVESAVLLHISRESPVQSC